MANHDARGAGAEVTRFEHVIPMFECRRYKWLPPLKWLIWDHFKDSGTLGALLRKGGAHGKSKGALRRQANIELQKLRRDPSAEGE